jgi:hypothetical protein
MYNYRHLGLDLSLRFYDVHFQVIGSLLQNVGPTCGTKRYVKISDFQIIFGESLLLYHKVNYRLWRWMLITVFTSYVDYLIMVPFGKCLLFLPKKNVGESFYCVIE